MLVEVEQLILMELDSVSQRKDYISHNGLCQVLSCHESQIDLLCDLECIIFDTYAEQFYKLLVFYAFKVDPQEMTDVISLAVHLHYQEDLFLVDQEPFSIVLCHTILDTVINQDFLIIGLSIFPDLLRLQFKVLFEEICNCYFGGQFCECDSDQFVISLL